MKKQIHFGNKSCNNNLDFEKLNELQKRLQGTSENSNPVTDPFKFLGEFDSYDKLNETLDTLTYTLGHQKGYGYFRARVGTMAIDIKSILVSSAHNAVGQVVQGMLTLNGDKKLTLANGTYKIYFRKHQNNAWGDWKDITTATSNSGSSSGGDINLSDYVTKEEFEEVENDLLTRISYVESDIPDIRINKESIVEDAIVNLEEHFKTINGKSIFASEKDKSLKCVEKVLIGGDINLNPENGVLDLRGVFGDVDLSDCVQKTDKNVQHIVGGLVIGSNDTPSAMQSGKHKGRIMLTGVENPLVGVQAGTTPYYIQANDNKMYIGPARPNATSFDSSGNVTIPNDLSVAKDIYENGVSLSKKYASKSELSATELAISDYVPRKIKEFEGTLPSVALTGEYEDLLNSPTIPTADDVIRWGFAKNTDTVKAVVVNGGNPIEPDSNGIVDLGYLSGESTGDGGNITGPVLGVTVDGEDVVVNGVAQIPAASTEKKGVVQLSHEYSTSDDAKVVTQKALYNAYTELAGNKQDKIEDLDNIIQGATLGLTSLQPGALDSKLDKDEAASTYLEKNGTVLFAESAVLDSEGNTIVDTYATKGELEETESNLINRIDNVESDIPDIRINNESIVNTSKIVNLETHFKTINDKSIFANEKDKRYTH